MQRRSLIMPAIVLSVQGVKLSHDPDLHQSQKHPPPKGRPHMVEVWLRNLPVTTDPLRHLLLCTLQQTEEDVVATTAGLTDE